MIVLSIRNLPAVRAAYQAAPQRMSTEARDAVARSVFTVESNVKREAPVNKGSGGGNLRQSVKGRMTGVASGVVRVEASYGVFVEEGTRPHMIRVRTKRVLADISTKQIFGTVVRHPGTRANRFFTRGVDRSRPAIEGHFTAAVRRVFS
jgi:HK97 gp10 family phage protein